MEQENSIGIVQRCKRLTLCSSQRQQYMTALVWAYTSLIIVHTGGGLRYMHGTRIFSKMMPAIGGRKRRNPRRKIKDTRDPESLSCSPDRIRRTLRYDKTNPEIKKKPVTMGTPRKRTRIKGSCNRFDPIPSCSLTPQVSFTHSLDGCTIKRWKTATIIEAYPRNPSRNVVLCSCRGLEA